MIKNISDINLLRKYMIEKGTGQTVEENTLTVFDSAEDVYAWTNEPLKEYYDFNSKNKKVLTVTSSGDYILHAALAGSKDITAFDINRFAKYYAALKIALIKTYTYEEFSSMFKVIDDKRFYLMGEIKKSSAEIQNKLLTIYKECSSYLTDEEKAFWEEYFKLYKNNMVRIIKTINQEHHTNNAYCKESEYKILRYNLNDCNIRFVDSNINSLYKKTNEKFDIMYISNIIGSILIKEPKNIFGLIKSLEKNLNQNGIIYDLNKPYCNWKDYLYEGLTMEKFNEIISKELQGFEVCEEKLTSGSVIKFKYKGQSI